MATSPLCPQQAPFVWLLALKIAIYKKKKKKKNIKKKRGVGMPSSTTKATKPLRFVLFLTSRMIGFLGF